MYISQDRHFREQQAGLHDLQSADDERHSALSSSNLRQRIRTADLRMPNLLARD
jgi:hypothetical protein